MIQDDIKSKTIDTIFIANIENIPLINVIKIDNNLFGRLDKIIKEYYNNRMELLPILMDFNNIIDPIDLNIGMILRLPESSYLESNLKINEILDNDIVPGILKTTNGNVINQDKKIINTKTTAVPKLNITVNKVSYNSKNGEVIF